MKKKMYLKYAILISVTQAFYIVLNVQLLNYLFCKQITNWQNPFISPEDRLHIPIFDLLFLGCGGQLRGIQKRSCIFQAPSYTEQLDIRGVAESIQTNSKIHKLLFPYQNANCLQQCVVNTFLHTSLARPLVHY